MCLYFNKKYHGENPEPRIAEKDIYVLKMLDKPKENKDGSISFPSPYMSFEYEMNTTYNSIFSIEKDYFENEFHVHKGLHAFTQHSFDINDHYNIFIAVIPKGSLFYIGKNDDIVSNQLRLQYVLKLCIVNNSISHKRLMQNKFFDIFYVKTNNKKCYNNGLYEYYFINNDLCNILKKCSIKNIKGDFLKVNMRKVLLNSKPQNQSIKNIFRDLLNLIC